MFNEKQAPRAKLNCGQEPAAAESGRKGRFTIKIITRGAVIRVAVLAAALLIFLLWAYFSMIKMPGKSYTGRLPALTDAQRLLRDELVRDVEKLAGEIGERNIWHYEKLAAAANFIETSLAEGGYKVGRQNFYRDELVLLLVDGFVNDSHAASAEFGQNAEIRDLFVCKSFFSHFYLWDAWETGEKQAIVF